MQVFLFCLTLILFLALVVVLTGIRFIPNNRIGVVEKRWSFGKGSIKTGFIALKGEVWYQLQNFSGGLRYLMPVQFME